jgi:hypothetical protein
MNKMMIVKWKVFKVNNIPLFLLIAFLCFASAGLSACSQGKLLTGSAREAVLAYSEPIADNLFQGLNASDYAVFSRDFNDPMLQGIPESSFSSSLIPSTLGKLGKYQSRQVASVTQIGSNVLIIYIAGFEKDPDVTVRLSLETAAPHKVSGLYFNSALLTQK